MIPDERVRGGKGKERKDKALRTSIDESRRTLHQRGDTKDNKGDHRREKRFVTAEIFDDIIIQYLKTINCRDSAELVKWAELLAHSKTSTDTELQHT